MVMYDKLKKIKGVSPWLRSLFLVLSQVISVATATDFGPAPVSPAPLHHFQNFVGFAQSACNESESRLIINLSDASPENCATTCEKLDWCMVIEQDFDFCFLRSTCGAIISSDQFYSNVYYKSIAEPYATAPLSFWQQYWVLILVLLLSVFASFFCICLCVRASRGHYRQQQEILQRWQQRRREQLQLREQQQGGAAAIIDSGVRADRVESNRLNAAPSLFASTSSDNRRASSMLSMSSRRMEGHDPIVSQHSNVDIGTESPTISQATALTQPLLMPPPQQLHLSALPPSNSLSISACNYV